MVGLVLGIILAMAGFAAKLHFDLKQANAEFTSSTAAFTAKVAALEQSTAELERQLSSAESEIDGLNEELGNEREDNERYEERVDELEKLATLDPELLAKYSKVFFLNENYEPSGLDAISTKYLLDPTKEVEFHEDAMRYLKRLMDAAAKANLTLAIASGYRWFETQATLKSGYRVTYGSGANAFSAEQGYSEHQLGTTVDLTTRSLASLTTSFETTKEFQWLTQNAYRYGFVLSYPKGNAYYQYEPWHWRFVGTDLARTLNRNGKYFYDMDQREIDEYLIDIF